MSMTEISATRTTLKIGQKVGDKGISPDTGEAMYTTRRDTGPPLTWQEARAFASRLDAPGHQDWRVPTNDELNVLFENRAAIGGFNISGSYPRGWYWSSSQIAETGAAWVRRFSDGTPYFYDKLNLSSLRCVREAGGRGYLII